MSMRLTIPLEYLIVPQKTFLQHCEEELAPKLRASFEENAILWKVAAVATLVAFAVLVLSAFVATGLFAPLYIPLIGISSIILLSQITSIYQMFQSRAAQASERAEQLKEINDHYQTLDASTPAQLQEILDQKGIRMIPGMQRNDPRLTTLKPLIARHLFWEGQTNSLQESAQEKLREAARLKQQNATGNREEIFQLRHEALEWENEALESKCKNAFINAVIRRPYYTGTLDDLGSFTEFSGLERAVNAANNISDTNNLFTFKNSSVPPIKYSDAKHSSVADLSYRFITPMPSQTLR